MTSARTCLIPYGIDHRLVHADQHKVSSDGNDHEYNQVTSEALDFLRVLSALNAGDSINHKRSSGNTRIGVLISCFWPEQYLGCFLDNLVLLNRSKRIVPIVINAGMSPSSKESILRTLDSGQFVDYGFIEKIDSTIYDAWNSGIEAFVERVDYFTNFNVDDRRHPLCLEVLAAALDTFQEKQVAVTDYLYFFEANTDLALLYFGYLKTCTFTPLVNSRTLTFANYPHSGPMWRSSIHKKNKIYFDGSSISAGDADFWLRVSQYCDDAFYVISIPLNLYYFNPEGLSTSLQSAGPEEMEIYKRRHSTKLKAILEERSSDFYARIPNNILDYNLFSFQLAAEALTQNV